MVDYVCCLDGGVGCCSFDERMKMRLMSGQLSRGWCGGASALVDYLYVLCVCLSADRIRLQQLSKLAGGIAVWVVD